MKSRIAVPLFLMFIIVVIAGLAFFLGTRHAQSDLSIKRVTATDIANAMMQDRFYADYGGSVLLVAGTVSALSMHGNDVIARLTTVSSFQALCDLGARAPHLRVGHRITVVAMGSSAQRQPSAVLLTGCTVP